VHLTTAFAREAACPPGKKEHTYRDDVACFFLRVRDTGGKTWVFEYTIAGRKEKVFLGSPHIVDAGKARAAAKDLAAQVRLGRNPAAEKRSARDQAKETVRGLLPRFLERQRGRLRPRSFEVAESMLRRHAAPLASLPVSKIDRRTASKFLTELAEAKGPITANRTQSNLSAFCTRLIRAGYLESNPFAYAEKAIEPGPRSRVLSDDELVAIWRALNTDEALAAHEYNTIVKLLLLTGARRNEIGLLTWQEINWDNATLVLPAARVKSNREHTIPLSPPALSILEEYRRKTDSSSGCLFGLRADRGYRGWHTGKQRLDARLDNAGTPIADWRHHDFRRSISTTMHERFNIPPHVVEAVLGHVGHQRGVAGVYNKAVYLDERRRALTRWADHIIGLATGEPAEAKVIKLR
jgi:integrase